METKQLNCNLLLIGKTGAGKSSFANYLFGTEIFTSGKGKPVTDWQHNFQFNYLMVEDIRVTVYDSVGLEADNSDKWLRELRDFLTERQNSHKADKIIHAVFYVINANNARIESYEFEIMQSIVRGFSIPAIAVLSNVDQAGTEKLNALEQILRERAINFTKVCSVHALTRVKESEPFGKKEALEFFLAAAYEKVGKDLAIDTLHNTRRMLRNLKNELVVEIENADISVFNMENSERVMEAIMNKLSVKFDDFSMENLFSPELRHYKTFLDSFNVDYSGKEVFDESLEEFSNILQDIDISEPTFLKKMEADIETFDDGTFFEQVGAVFNLVPVILNIKGTIKTGIQEMFAIFDEKIGIVIENLQSS